MIQAWISQTGEYIPLGESVAMYQKVVFKIQMKHGTAVWSIILPKDSAENVFILKQRRFIMELITKPTWTFRSKTDF